MMSALATWNSKGSASRAWFQQNACGTSPENWGNHTELGQGIENEGFLTGKSATIHTHTIALRAAAY